MDGRSYTLPGSIQTPSGFLFFLKVSQRETLGLIAAKLYICLHHGSLSGLKSNASSPIFLLRLRNRNMNKQSQQPSALDKRSVRIKMTNYVLRDA